MKQAIGIAIFGWMVLGAACQALALASDAPVQRPVFSPSQYMPRLPKAPTPAPVASDIPTLPFSPPCKKQDVNGLWKLAHVYESPPAAEIAAFEGNPMQYILFKPGGVYGRFNAGKNELPPTSVIEQINQHTAGDQQFIAQDSGVIYFYQDQVAVDAQACFIVGKSSGVFLEGQMILMPPRGQIAGQLVKVYTRVWPLQRSTTRPSRPMPQRKH